MSGLFIRVLIRVVVNLGVKGEVRGMKRRESFGTGRGFC